MLRTSRRALAAGALVAGALAMSAGPALAAGDVDAAFTTPVRVEGPTRYQTAVQISQATYPDNISVENVVLATGTNYPDALAGTPLAHRAGGPILLTPPNVLEPTTQTELQRVLNPSGTVWILGGTVAISAEVEAGIRSLGFDVERLAGADRFETSVKIAEAVFPPGAGVPDSVFVADGGEFQDAIVSGPAAAHENGVVVLSNGAVLPDSVATYVNSLPDSTIRYIVGASAFGSTPGEQIGTADPYETSAAVAMEFWHMPGAPGAAGYASGEAFPDGLTGGAHIAHEGGPLLLLAPTEVPTPVGTWTSAHALNIFNAYVYGGPVAISQATFQALSTLLAAG